MTGEPISDDDPWWTAFQAENAALGWTKPTSTIAAFIMALKAHDNTALEALVVPGTSWGDFEGAHALFRNPSLWGLGTKVLRVDGFPNVAYLQMIPGVEEATFGQERTDHDVMVNLCWSEERQRWLIYSFGEAKDPGDLPEID